MVGLPAALAQHDPASQVRLREIAAQRLLWHAPDAPQSANEVAAKRAPARIQILAINDFHGALSAGVNVGPRRAGGAALLAAYLKNEARQWPSVIVHAGDHVGATPANSALLQDEPAIAFLNTLANPHCMQRALEDVRCNVLGTLGNHEFDEGRVELLRLIYGGTHARGPFLEHPYQGAKFAYVCANVFDAAQGEFLLPPYVVREVGGVRVGFIGAVLKQTPSIVPAPAIAGLQFLDEAQAINRQVAALKRAGVRAIVVLLHQGGYQRSVEQAKQPAASSAANEGELDGADINAIIHALDDEVDVLVSGHAHGFTNLRVPNANGKTILVTQAFFSGSAYADIELTVDRASGEVVASDSAVITTFADAGLAPDEEVARLVARADAHVASIVRQAIAQAAEDISNLPNENGESPLGQLIADAQRTALGADLALMNPGGIRSSLSAGTITWGDVFSVHPFGNRVMKVELTGAQVLALLNEQWRGAYPGRLLAVSGVRYAWDATQPLGARVRAVRIAGRELEETATYTLAVNDFLLYGGDGFATLKQAVNAAAGPLDRDALIAYLRAQPQPLRAAHEVRVQRID